MRASVLAVLVPAILVSALPATAGRKSRQNDGLLQVVTPVHRETTLAHPHVNVLVVLGSGYDGIRADPSTFRAKLGRRDVTALFEPLLPGEIPGATGFRARLDPQDLKVGRAKNTLKLQVRSQSFPRGKRLKSFRDKDKVKFAVEDAANQPPTALAAADSDLIIQGIPIHFDGSASQDPELDGLEYTWEFGDGTTSTEIRPSHVYEGIGSGDVEVTLTVSDGAESSSSRVLLLARPPVDPDRTPGGLRVDDVNGALEVGPVDVGSSAHAAFVVQNLDGTPTSQLKVVMETDDPAFSLDPPFLDLAAGESREVRVVFTPGAAGHASTRVGLVASATGISTVSLLAHGHGGAAPGTGPTLAADPLYFKRVDASTFIDQVWGVFPDGRRITIDSEIGGCSTAGFTGLGDACFEDADCAVHGGTCGATCRGGANDGQDCTLPSDCPGGDCFPASPLFVEDLCGDAFGNVYILSDDGTFTEPEPDRLTERSVTLARLSFDDQGAIQERTILRRLNGETYDIACDGVDGGNVYTPEYWDVESDTCFRIERQALTQIRKTNGLANVLENRLDSVQGIDGCNDLEDTADAIAVSRTGQTIFANFQDGGIWRASPSPRPFLVNALDSELVEIHPDGSLLYATASNLGTVALVSLYKITEAQVAAGPVSLQAVPACASITLPTNGAPMLITGMAGGRAASASSDGVAFVAFQAAFTAGNAALDRALVPRGTLVFTSPADGSACTVEGLVAADAFELASF